MSGKRVLFAAFIAALGVLILFSVAAAQTPPYAERTIGQIHFLR